MKIFLLAFFVNFTNVGTNKVGYRLVVSQNTYALKFSIYFRDDSDAI